MKVSVILVPCFLLFLAPQASEAYPKGPPVGACVHMFPVGHKADAQMTPPPFELLVNKQKFRPQEDVQVTLKVKEPNPQGWYFEGVFVQARMANCMVHAPVGTFKLNQNENFLKLLNCSEDKLESAVGHQKSEHKNSVTFTWTSPKSEPGKIFFRATVVKNLTTFWTNVFSEYLDEDTDTSKDPEKYCEVQTKLSDSASVPSAAMSLLLAAFVGRLFV